MRALLTDEYRGLARYGDGDFAVMRGQRDRYQQWDPMLAAKLAQFLGVPTPGVLNAIIPPPGIGDRINQRWHCYKEANAGIIGLLPDRIYGDASLSRMDSNIQLHTEEWWLEISKLWADQEITLIRGSERSLTAPRMLESPGSPEAVTEILSPVNNAWTDYDCLLTKVLDAGHERVILCTGLVARPLVHAIVAHGLRAYDLGHLGMWFREGKPIEVLHP